MRELIKLSNDRHDTGVRLLSNTNTIVLSFSLFFSLSVLAMRGPIHSFGGGDGHGEFSSDDIPVATERGDESFRDDDDENVFEVEFTTPRGHPIPSMSSSSSSA
jgi:hypothetical protein